MAEDYITYNNFVRSPVKLSNQQDDKGMDWFLGLNEENTSKSYIHKVSSHWILLKFVINLALVVILMLLVMFEFV